MSKKGFSIRKENAEKYDYAYDLYLTGLQQKTICERVGITPATFIAWREKGGWAEKRAALTVSVDSIIAKSLRKIDEMLDKENFDADAYSKAVAQLKTLKGRTTVDDKIVAFTSFGDFLIAASQGDNEVTAEFIKKVTTYQDKYIMQELRYGNKL